MDFNLNIAAVSDDQRAVELDEKTLYDVLIVGGGPAALTAAVYCMRKGVKTGLATLDFGGQVTETWSVENYLGFKYIEGIELAEKFKEHVRQFEIALGEGARVTRVVDGGHKTVELENGRKYRSKAVIITTGKSSRKLNVPGEKELTGRGVAYCSICDGPLFAGKKVAVVGGGNSGIESAIDLAKVAEHVAVVQFLDKLTADDILIKTLQGFSNVDYYYEHEVKAINGPDKVTGVTIADRNTGDAQELALDGIFIEIGLVPNSDAVKDLIELNKYGEIEVDCSCKTSVPGIFAAGDVTTVPYKQIIIASGEGAKAALSACDYVLKL